jgi:hypothetical protein
VIVDAKLPGASPKKGRLRSKAMAARSRFYNVMIQQRLD